jgi:hypothetical protein
MKDDCELEAEIENKTCEFLKTRIKLLLMAYPTKLEVVYFCEVQICHGINFSYFHF